jgi:hypothetical protein
VFIIAAAAALVAAAPAFAQSQRPADPTGASRPAGPAVHGLGLIANHAYSAPYEDLKLKGK